MWEEIRNHSFEPTEHEREWMAVRPRELLARLGIQLLVALAVGMGGSYLVQAEQGATLTVAAAPGR